jgi:hypothetical protein
MAEEDVLRAMVAAKCIDADIVPTAIAPGIAPITASPAR